MSCDLPRRGYLWNYAELISDCAGSCTGFTVQTFLKPDRKVVVDGGHCSCTCHGEYLTLLFKVGNTYKV